MRNKLKLLSLDESPPLPPESPPSAAPPWTELPSDVTANILQRLGALEILNSAQLVCATWWRICHDPAMWRVIKIESLFLDHYGLEHCNIACRRAVDRSQGQLIDLHVAYNCDDELLDYIANRCTHLRRLKVAPGIFFDSVSLSGMAVVEAVKKLRELEEFRLLTFSTLVPADVESIAISCPSLTSFALNLSLAPKSHSHNEYVLAISKFMPSLHHLQLICFKFDDMRLEDILDGCHHLQSLDLRDGYGVDLGRALGKRFRDQIKDLPIPLPSDEDYDDYPSYYYFGYDGTFDPKCVVDFRELVSIFPNLHV